MAVDWGCKIPPNSRKYKEIIFFYLPVGNNWKCSKQEKIENVKKVHFLFKEKKEILRFLVVISIIFSKI